MNTRKLFATSLIALASVAASSAFADSYDREFPIVATPSHSTVTRAEVRAELVQAQKDGSLSINDNEYPVIHATGASKTRDEVRAETAAAMKDGTLDLRGDYRG